MTIFNARKGHFAPGKRALGKTWGAWPPLAPPGSYAPGPGISLTIFLSLTYLDLNKWTKLTIFINNYKVGNYLIS